MKFNFKIAAALMALAGLAACGGGATDEDGDGKLYVDVHWTGEASLLQSSTITPVITGLEGNKPHCALKSGSLPPGMSMTDTCNIVGKPQKADLFYFVADFSVKGVDNHLDFGGSVFVSEPWISYTSPDSPKLGQTVDIAPAFLGKWQPQQGTTLSFRVVSGALPAGVTLDASTGHISGTISAMGTFGARIGAKVTTDAGSADVRETSVQFNVPGATVQYPAIEAVVGVPLTQVLPTGMQAGASYSFSWNSQATPPAGLTLDPGTGAISGMPTQSQASSYLYISYTAGDSTLKQVQTGYNAVLPYAISYSCATGRVNQAFSCSPTISVAPAASQAGVTASSAMYTYSIASGASLPAGLTLNAATGTISGTPTTSSAGYGILNVNVSLGGATFVLRPLVLVNVLN